jgi:hypothetical protein
VGGTAVGFCGIEKG